MSWADVGVSADGRGVERVSRWTAAVLVVVGLATTSCAAEAGDEPASPPAAEDEETATEAPATTTSTVPNVDGWPLRTSPDGAYTIALPIGWTMATLDGDSAGIAALLVDGLPFEAEVTEAVVFWQQAFAHSVAISPGGWTPDGPRQELVVTFLSGWNDVAAAVDYYRQRPPYEGMVVDGVDEVPGERGVLTRISVSMPTRMGPAGFIYLVPDGAGNLWELKLMAYSERSEGLSERMALSFTPLTTPV
jgi:hypothetical protein